MTRRAASSRGAVARVVRRADGGGQVKAARGRHRNSRIALALVAAVLGFAHARSVAAASGQDPDWPCIQRKVSEISPAQVWSGPPFDTGDEAWRNDDAVAELAAAIASRRTEMADAKAKIADFAAVSGADRNRRLTLLFAGILASINAERSSIMAGIGRYARRQHALAEKISGEAAALDRLPAQGGTNDEVARRQELSQAQEWDTRIFRERERSLRYVCELPTLLEQRAFALGKEVVAQLQK
jgi:hypothetical protein